MTEKEKAKAYDEAIERAKKLYGNGIAEEIFTELKESEDKKIRKEIISILRNAYWTSNRNRFNELVAWLEKQGEQKPQGKSALEAIKEEKVDNANKVEPEFKVGDWITFYGSNPFKILKIESEINGVLDYLLLDQNGHDFYFNKAHVDKNTRLWTIQDAKDGDIIHLGTVTAIFKKYIGSEKCICYCSFCKDGSFEIPIENGEDNIYGCYNATPITKEQCDAFMKIMKDAGYKWDTEKKELKKEKSKIKTIK